MAWQKIQIICPTCEGKKEVGGRESTEPDFYIISECKTCNGKGYIPWGRLKVESDTE